MSWRGRLAKAYARAFSRPACVPLHRLLFKLSVRGLGVLNHHGFEASGELSFLRRVLGPIPAPVVLDVGAHRGRYARAVLGVSPRAVVHALEPHPVPFAELSRVEGLAGAYRLAASAQRGKARLYDASERSGSELATLVPGVFELLYARRPAPLEVETTTLDAFVEERGIERVDLLKIDVEGHELEVLRGAERLLRERRVGWIQLEFGAPQLVNHGSVLALSRALEGYKLYRVLGHGLLELDTLAPYEREIFAYQNLVARPLAP